MALRRDVLSYAEANNTNNKSDPSVEDQAKTFVQAVDNALPATAVQHLRHVFRAESLLGESTV